MLAVAAMMLLASCGPEKKVTLGVRDISTDILLSGAKPPAPPSLPDPPLPTPPGFPFVPTPVNTGVDSDGGVFIPLPPKPSPTKAPPPVRCPKAPEYVAPRHEATLRPTGKPIAATYDVRVDGEFAIDGEHKATGVYPPAGTRTIGEVADLPGGAGWSYSIADETGLVTSYQVIPKPVGDEAVSNVDSANQPVPTQPGIYISKFSYKRTDGTTLTLDPEPSVMVAKLPFAQGERWTSRGFDAATGISVVVNGQTGLGVEYRPARARVDACGTVLDAFWVEYTIDTTPIADAVANNEPPSQREGPELLVKFVGSQVAFATQFGGIPIEEIYKLDGTDKTETLQITRHSVYSREPALPEAT
jgi:hypothetical protein